ncbi:tetratricopeptide repeat protein [Actinoplanes siamensis]|uniref:tetratricopeptide repeat protein n=1 Tax=Actinoplanes siamensis TaxID=1223317 RepID=UPI0036072221
MTQPPSDRQPPHPQEEPAAPVSGPSREEPTAPVSEPPQEELTAPVSGPSREEPTAPVSEPPQEELTAPVSAPSQEEPTALVAGEPVTAVSGPSREEPTTPVAGWPQQPAAQQPGWPQPQPNWQPPQGWPQQTPQPGPYQMPQQAPFPGPQSGPFPGPYPGPQQQVPQGPPPAWNQQPQPGWPQPAYPQQGWPPPPQLMPPAPPKPPREPKKADRLAVAAANASFLSIGYFMMRRAGLGIATLLVTLVLLFFVVPAVHTVLIEVVAVLWWLAMMVSGYFLARGPVEPAARTRQRVLGIASAAVVLLVLGLLRVQAGAIGRTVSDAKATGDCAHALDSLDRVWLGLRVADAPLAAKGDDTVTACRDLDAAGRALTAGLAGGDVTELDDGFGRLDTVLTTLPGHEKMTDTVLDRFLTGIPTRNPCDTVKITEWLSTRQKTGNTLDRAADVVAEHQPAALLGCGDAYLGSKSWIAAKNVYQQLVDTYPDDPGKARAQAGIAKADLAIELDTLKERTSGSPAKYCSSPSRYSAAKPYGKGVNRAMYFGNSTQSDRLPGSWKTTDPEAATLVVCIGEDKSGAATRTCSYRSNFGSGRSYPVTFHKVAFTVKGYEIRTGKVVFSQTVQVGGSSCPSTISYSSTLGTDLGPPRHMDVTVNSADVKAQFQKLIVR